MQKLLSLFSKTPEWFIVLFVVVLPLLWIPLTPDSLEFNKQALVLIAAPLVVFVWLMRSQRKGEVHFSIASPLAVGAIFSVVLAVASLFSQDSWRSFIGFGAGSHESLATSFALFALAATAVPLFRDPSWLLKTLWGLVIASVFSGVIGIVASLGIGERFPEPFVFSPGFNTIGTISMFAVFLAAGIIASLGLAMVSKGPSRIIATAALIFLFITLAIFGVPRIWWVMAFAALVLFAAALRNAPQFYSATKLFANPPLIAGIAIAFALLQPNIFRNIFPLPIEVAPGQAATVAIAKNTLKSNPLFGSGPGTWLFDYSKYRDPEPLNDTPLWSLRFTQGSSKILSLPATHGVIGSFAWLGVLISVAFLGIKKLMNKNGEMNLQFPTIFGFWAIMAGSQFVGGSNMTLDGLFWIATAMMIGSTGKDFLQISLPKGSARGAFFGMIVSFVGILLLIALYAVGSRYFAAAQYMQGITRAQQGNIAGGIEKIAPAISLDARNDLYLRSFSEAWLLRLAELLQKQDTTQEEIVNAANGALASASQSTRVSPHNVVNWIQLAKVQTNILSLGAPSTISQGVDEAALSWRRAEELEPASPFLPTQRAITYLNAADTVAELGDEGKTLHAQYLADAKKSLEKALELKGDYAPAQFQMAMLFIREGKTDEAISRLEIAQQLSPSDLGVAAQLGVLYYNAGRLKDAKNLLEQVVTASQQQGGDHADARYFLGLIADKEGRIDDAIAQFERILELNPGNILIERILANLKTGKPALEGIAEANTPPPPVSTEEPTRVPEEKEL